MKVLISEKLNAINKNTKWLSDITEIPYPTLSRIVKGEDLKSIPVATFDKICTALNCGISDILSTEEDDIIKEKVKTENNKVILEERLNILHSLNKIKTIVGYKNNFKYDDMAIMLEELFNSTTFVNKKSDEKLMFPFRNENTLEDIISFYDDIHAKELDNSQKPMVKNVINEFYNDLLNTIVVEHKTHNSKSDSVKKDADKLSNKINFFIDYYNKTGKVPNNKNPKMVIENINNEIKSLAEIAVDLENEDNDTK